MLTERPYTLSVGSDRTRVPARGYGGGGTGGRGAVFVHSASFDATGRAPEGEEQTTKAQVALQPDQRFTLQLPGGGGFWDPLTRDPELVLTDVLDQFVSVEEARREYGVDMYMTPSMTNGVDSWPRCAVSRS